MHSFTPITFSEPQKETVTRTRIKITRQAQHKEIDTGVRRVIEKIVNGETIREEKPITERILIPAMQEDEPYQIDVWAVYSDDGANRERHEFTTLEAANVFLGKDR